MLRRHAKLRTHAPLRARKPMRKRRDRPRRSPRVVDIPRRAWIRTQPCCSPAPPSYHDGPIDPHHTGKRAMGRKADDDTCVPLCRRCHDAWDEPDFSTSTGPFHGWTREQKREWAAEQVAIYRAKYLGQIDAGRPRIDLQG
jgi:hypothetical protein